MYSMGDDTDSIDVQDGDNHLSARVDDKSHRSVKIAAAQRDESMAEFVRYAVDRALKDLEEGEEGNGCVAAMMRAD